VTQKQWRSFSTNSTWKRKSGLNPFRDPVQRERSKFSEEIQAFFFQAHHEIPLPYANYSTQVRCDVEKLNPPPLRGSFARISMTFMISTGALDQLYRRSGAPTKFPSGRPNRLRLEEFDALQDSLWLAFVCHGPVTYSNLSDFIFERFEKHAMNGTHRHITSRMCWCKTILGPTMEAERLASNDQEIEQ
jgi:hypothetical protein